MRSLLSAAALLPTDLFLPPASVPLAGALCYLGRDGLCINPPDLLPDRFAPMPWPFYGHWSHRAVLSLDNSVFPASSFLRLLAWIPLCISCLVFPLAYNNTPLVSSIPYLSNKWGAVQQRTGLIFWQNEPQRFPEKASFILSKKFLWDFSAFFADFT